MFAVLKPEFVPTLARKPNGEVIYAVGWEKIGEAKNLADARSLARFPVLSNEPNWLRAEMGEI